MDKDLQNIINKANLNEKPKPEVKPYKSFKRNEPYDYLVFTKLTRLSGYKKLIFLFGIPATLSAGFSFKEFENTVVLTLLV